MRTHRWLKTADEPGPEAEGQHQGGDHQGTTGVMDCFCHGIGWGMAGLTYLAIAVQQVNRLLWRCFALAFELGFGADVERLKNPRIDGCNHIHGAVQIDFVNTRFPCVRKAAFHSRLAIAHHGDGKTHEYLFAFAQIFNGVSIAVKPPEISSFNHPFPSF
jgi:hypothetical protein